MRRLLYILVEIAAVYSLLLGLGALVIWLYDGFGDIGSLIFLGYAVLSAFAAIKLAVIGRSRGIWRGIYNPIRPVEAIATATAAMRDTSELPVYEHKQPFAIEYSGRDDLPSFEVVYALAAALEQCGIKHTNTGNLTVEDNRTLWRVEPVLGEKRLVGWIASNDPGDCRQILQGLRDFLGRDLGLRVA